MLQSFGVRTEKVLRNFAPDPGLDKIRHENRMNTLVFLGGLEPIKGIRTLIDAFEQCRDSQGFILEIIGDGSLRKELERKVRISKLGDRVRFRGYLQRASWLPILRNSSRLVIPSECYENAPLSALEAFSLGVPVIGSRIGGLPEILTEESDSVLFNPGDCANLAETLVGEWRKVLQARSFSDKARHAYEVNFSPEVFYRRYMGVIKEIDLAK
jgi:glycosyltransferase involved in cell wall biosynthesis